MAVPAQEKLTELHVMIGKVIQYKMNGKQALAATEIAAIKVIVDAAKTAIDAATDANITTLTL